MKFGEPFQFTIHFYPFFKLFPSSHSSHGTLFSHRETAGLPFLGGNAFGAKVDCFGQQVNGHLARTGLEISSAP
jgi:hypothetical protein